MTGYPWIIVTSFVSVVIISALGKDLTKYAFALGAMWGLGMLVGEGASELMQRYDLHESDWLWGGRFSLCLASLALVVVVRRAFLLARHLIGKVIRPE